MGYVRDNEMAKVLTRARKQMGQEGAQETLVYVSEVPVDKHYPDSPAVYLLYQAARDAASLLGYGLTNVTVERDVRTHKAVSRTLIARGLRGLILAPFTQWSPARLEFDWAQFASVEIGTTLDWPPTHRIEREYHEDLLELYDWLRSKGYRRIGLAFSKQRIKFLKYIPESSLLLYEQWHADMVRVPPLYDSYEWNIDGFQRWLKAEEPEVIIIFESDARSWLKQIGVGVPENLGVVHLFAQNGNDTGLIPDMSLMAAEAVHMLCGMVKEGQWGLPRRRRTHAFRSIFQEGKSIREIPLAPKSL